jgi:hypothetical protein
MTLLGPVAFISRVEGKRRGEGKRKSVNESVRESDRRRQADKQIVAIISSIIIYLMNIT